MVRHQPAKNEILLTLENRFKTDTKSTEILDMSLYVIFLLQQMSYLHGGERQHFTCYNVG